MSQRNSKLKTYSEMIQLSSFNDRFNYLRLNGIVGNETFGFDRYLNQKFYQSKEWKHIRDQIIIRDNGCDLGISDREIAGPIYIHHMNPINIEDISDSTEFLLNPEYLVCVSLDTHNAIHYGDETLIHKNEFLARTRNDTCPWKN